MGKLSLNDIVNSVARDGVSVAQRGHKDIYFILSSHSFVFLMKFVLAPFGDVNICCYLLS